MAREIPSYISQMQLGSMPQAQFTDAGANATRKLSAEMGVIADDMHRKTQEMTDLQIETDYKENLHRIYQANRADPAKFEADYQGFYKKFSAEAPNTDFKQKLDIQHDLMAQSYRDRITEQHYSNQEDDYKTMQLKALTVNKAMLGEAFKALSEAKTPEARQSAMAMVNQINERDSEILSSKDYMGRNRYSPEALTRDLMERGKIAFEALPARKRLEVLGEGAAGFQSAQMLVRKHEGGFNPSDGNTGQPTLYGVSKKWHPEGYAEIEKAQQSGNAAGQAAADAYLKKTFWDKYDIDSLDPRVQGLVYDGAVNHHTKFREKLVAAAKSGASVTELFDMRQAEYDRLEKSGNYSKADVASWNNRLQDYQHLTVADYGKYVDPDTISTLKDRAVAELQAEAKLWREDAPKAAMIAGARTPQEIVQSQNIPVQFARVIDNEQAQVMAQEINQFQTSDDILGFAEKLNGTYGEFTPNAIRDLKEAGKMKPEMEGAISLASTGNPAYKEHIDLLAQVGRAGRKSIDTMFVTNQFSEATLKTKLSDQIAEWQKSVFNEGKDPAEVQEKLEVAISLAKAKMSKSLDGNYDDAIEFALKPEFDQYAIRQANGVDFRIPSKYNADNIEDSVSFAMGVSIPKMAKGSKDADYVFSGAISPFLSPNEDGVMFRTPMGEPVVDAKGKVVHLKFDELAKPKAKAKIEMNKEWGPAL